MRNQFCDVRFCLEERGRRVLQFIIGNETRLRLYEELCIKG